jgi:ubiquinone/menaquinone biosynthesis C-methylase UbiE
MTSPSKSFNTDLSHDLTRQNYDHLSRWYDLFSSSERRFTEAGLRLLDARPGENILEIGCGTGHALVELAKAVGDSGKVHGIDLSTGMLAVAGTNLARAGLAGRVHLQPGDATCLPYSDGQFDAVFMSFTLELFSSDEIPLVLSESRRVLRTSGRLGVVTLAKKESTAVKIYEWFHEHLPRVVDCRPIFLQPMLETAGFAIKSWAEAKLWGLPAEAVLSTKS